MFTLLFSLQPLIVVEQLVDDYLSLKLFIYNKKLWNPTGENQFLSRCQHFRIIYMHTKPQLQPKLPTYQCNCNYFYNTCNYFIFINLLCFFYLKFQSRRKNSFLADGRSTFKYNHKFIIFWFLININAAAAFTITTSTIIYC